MPFGVQGGPATFSRIMRKLLDGSKSLDNFFDDVIAHTDNWERHMVALREFLSRVRNANIKLKPKKCSVGYSEIPFLGHQVGHNTISPNVSTVTKILNAARPTTKTQLRSFLSLVGYYRKFIPNFAAIALPLTDLTKKGTPNNIDWGPAQETAFSSLKQYVSEPSVLKLPNFNEKFIVQTDASNERLGAILLQTENGVKHPIAFASKKLLAREKNYSTIEKECLAIVWGVQKFEQYLYGKHFVLETDHQPLQYLGKTQYQNGRLMRWALGLQPYRFT